MSRPHCLAQHVSPTWPPTWHRKCAKNDENQNKSGHIEN